MSDSKDDFIYVNPYVEHGKKSTDVKKITVSIPKKVHEMIIFERERRKNLNLMHATVSDLICEAFLHSFTSQPLPKDEDLIKNKKNIAKKNKYNELNNHE